MTTELSLGPSLHGFGNQRSHLLLVLSNPQPGRESAFLQWYQGPCREAIASAPRVLSLRLYARHAVDITRGRWPPPPFQYLGLCELSLDGAQAAENLIERIAQLHLEQPAARAPATWLYYPSSEKVGRLGGSPSMLIVAFANGLAGQKSEFREWYATRHIRHALLIPALVSGQCFERTQFQRPGALPASFSTVAIYEEEGGSEAFFEGEAAVPKGALRFPSLDATSPRFGEALYEAFS